VGFQGEMLVRTTVAALGGVVCLALLLLIVPSVKDRRTSLLQGIQKDVQQYNKVKSTLGKELDDADTLTLQALNVPVAQAKKTLQKATNKINRESHILSDLEARVKRRAIVDAKQTEDEPLALRAVKMQAASQVAMIKKEKAVAHSMYLSALKKLQLEQAKARALMGKGAKPAANAPAVHTAPVHAAPKPALHAAPNPAKAAKAAAKGANAAPVSGSLKPKGKLPLSTLYTTPLVNGYATVRHCAVDGGAGCGYPPEVGTFEHGTPHKKVEKAVAECIPPKVLEDDVCVDDPRSEPLPVLCRERPEGEACKQWKEEKAAAHAKHMDDLRDTYHYRYRTHWYNPGDSHTIHPQRYPHKDGSDLGDNYISGWQDSHEPGANDGTFADHMSNAQNLKSGTPMTLSPFAGGADDLRTPPTSEHLKPPIAAMEKRNPLFHSFIHDDVVPIDHYHKMLWRYAKRSRPNHRDTFRGKMGNRVVKGFADGKLDPFGFNDGLADDEQPAVQAFNHHKYLAYGRKFEKEPISDMALNGWHGQHGVPPMVESGPESGDDGAGPAAAGDAGCVPDPPSPDNPNGSVCIDGVKFWRGKPKWCIRFCLPKGNPDAQMEYELLGHPPTAEDIKKINGF